MTSDRCSSVSILHSSGDLSCLILKNIGALIILSFVQPWNFTSATSSGLTQTGSLYMVRIEWDMNQPLLFPIFRIFYQAYQNQIHYHYDLQTLTLLFRYTLPKEVTQNNLVYFLPLL